MNTAIIVAAAAHNSKKNKSNKKSNVLSDILTRECEELKKQWEQSCNRK